MRIYNIVIQENTADPYQVASSSREAVIASNLGAGEFVSSNINKHFLQVNLPVPVYCQDLLDFAISVYAADQVVSRADNGYQGWSRHIRIHFPVADPSAWEGIRAKLEQMLSFLSGDRWELVFRQKSPSTPVSFARAANDVSRVCLLSGGLDSLVGAIDLLEVGEKVAFVSHYKRGSEGVRQPGIYSKLKERYPGRVLENRFYVQPNQQHADARKEDTSRSRSFLFLSIGLVMAHAYGAHVPLIVPENGLISLNVPLTPTRLSSHSTRTTHPHYFDLFRQVLDGLGIQNKIVNPYRFLTKGEMMDGCKNKPLLKSMVPETLSCSHPDVSRYVAGSTPGLNCGYCVPCIIRQAAEKKAGMKRGATTRYAFQIKYNPPSHSSGKGRDLRAFKMALEEIKNMPPHSLALRVLKSGPLPFVDRVELDKYLSLYSRGMAEDRNFLR